MTAPKDIQSKSDENPQSFERPKPIKMKAIISERRLPSFLKNLSGSRKINPRSAPTKSAPPISITGGKTVSLKDVPLPAIAEAIAIESEYIISAVASSIATTERSVSVSLPFALYCLITIIVAAGAVAAAIEPSTSENVIPKPAARSARTTNTTAKNDSRHAMTIGVAPTRLK